MLSLYYPHREKYWPVVIISEEIIVSRAYEQTCTKSMLCSIYLKSRSWEECHTRVYHIPVQNVRKAVSSQVCYCCQLLTKTSDKVHCTLFCTKTAMGNWWTGVKGAASLLFFNRCVSDLMRHYLNRSANKLFLLWLFTTVVAQSCYLWFRGQRWWGPSNFLIKKCDFWLKFATWNSEIMTPLFK